MTQRRSISVDGAVQGVGFRPFVFGLARERGLAGFVRNDAAGVEIEIEGEPGAIESFLRALAEGPPPLARVDRVTVGELEPRGAVDFRIRQSEAADAWVARVPPDTATCDDCLRELFDPADRRYRYPFLNCTHCGPRLTIVRGLPYDRSRTTLASFALCDACRAEYEDPADRRFHAQPTACPACGPTLVAREADDGPDAGTVRASDDALAAGDDALAAAVGALRAGRVVALKGLGGYHLAVDAADEAAVARLRERKHREAKPLAIMVPDLESAHELCEVGEAEAALLVSPRRPIVLLRKRTGEDGAGSSVAEAVAPGHRYLGVMLPYTPLHHLLMRDFGGPLVMTSGNRTEEPIVFRQAEAHERLAGIADLYLDHDRPIETRCDDSVTRVMAGGEVPVRRSRGYAPDPVRLPIETPVPLLAVGGHLKNTFCLARGQEAFPGHHIGDLENLAALEAFESGIDQYARLLSVEPEAVAHDLHPDYLSTRHALALRGVERIGVQHHHAHVAGCAAEHGVLDPVIGVAFDGTGYGPDGAVWGGEVMISTLDSYARAAHLAYVPLPGGEAAVRQPWRMALSHLLDAFEGELPTLGLTERLAAFSGERRFDQVRRVIEAGVAGPPTSSMGRLFDAVSALLGVRFESRYEGEAAIDLEMATDPRAADPDFAAPYPIDLIPSPGSVRIWRTGSLIREIVAEIEGGKSPDTVGSRFHATVSQVIVELCVGIRDRGGPRKVALSGGVFQNAILTERTAAALERAGFEVLLHRLLPSNDGGLSYGQAAVAAARLAARPSGS